MLEYRKNENPKLNCSELSTESRTEQGRLRHMNIQAKGTRTIGQRKPRRQANKQTEAEQAKG